MTDLHVKRTCPARVPSYVAQIAPALQQAAPIATANLATTSESNSVPEIPC